MADQSPDSALCFPAARAIEAGRALPASPLAEEVVSLFDQLRNPLLRYVINFGLPVQDGEDIVQEVFLSLYRHLQRGRSRSNLRAWLFRVARNLALKRRIKRSGVEQVQEEGAALLDLLTDPSPNPEDQMASSQRRQRLMAVVKALPEQDRHCLILRSEGLRYREIAEVLDISLGSVAFLLERALTRLARAAQW